MRLNPNVSIYGHNKNGVILFFPDTHRNEGSYNSFLYRLASEDYLIGYVCGDDFASIIKTMKIRYEENVILFAHGNGYERMLEAKKLINHNKIILASPVKDISKEIDCKTLILWSDGDKKYHNHKTANKMYMKLRNNEDVTFIGYPHVSFFLFAGVHYSQYHDKIDYNRRYTIFNKDKYDHLSLTVLNDLLDFLNDKPKKENIVICSDNYLPFSSGVNILVSLLKEELTKLGNKRVYILTHKLKGVDYCYAGAEENIITIPSHYVPGKKSKSDCLVYSVNPNRYVNNLLAYDFNYLHLQTEFTIQRIANRLKKKLDIPSVYTAQTMWNDMFDKRFPKPVAKFVNKWVNKHMLKPPQMINEVMTVPTFKVLNYYGNFWNKSKSVVVIPGCVDNDRFMLKEDDDRVLNRLRQKFNLFDKQVLGYVGRVSMEKHINLILEYFNKVADKYPNLVFMIVGGGPYEQELIKLVSESPYKDRVILTGNIPNRAIKYYYRLFDCFCTASTFETQGLTYIEAMWCKTALLVKKDSCLDDFMVNMQNGIIFDDFESWSKGLDIILNDKEFRAQMIENGFITASGYEKAVWAKKIYFLYNEAKLIKNKEKEEADWRAMKLIK